MAVTIKKALPLCLVLFASPVLSDVSLEALPDLTEGNLVHYAQRCGALYKAFAGVTSLALLDTDDPLEVSSLKSILERSEDNSDGLMKVAILVLTARDGMDDARAINESVLRRDGLATGYLQLFFASNSSISDPLRDEVWSNDLAACAAFAKYADELVKEYVDP